MEITKGFYDFCIPYNSDKLKLLQILKELHNFGYRTVAIEQIFNYTNKDNIKKKSDIFPEPIDLEFFIKQNIGLKIVQRLTIIFNNNNTIINSMTSSENLKKYELLAVLPTDENSLNLCCTTLNVDIISFNPEDSRSFISRKSYQLATRRGLCFEIKYSQAIVNTTFRKNMIKIAHNYHAKGKSKNIIFSSGATSAFEIRSPYDVANLGLIFGLTEEQSKSSISTICRLLFLKAESRRIGKTIMIMRQLGPVALQSSDEDESDTSSDEDNTLSVPCKKQKIN